MITIEEVKEAYNRLKTHVYYDTSDLFIRRRLAEFETNLSQSEDIFSINTEYLNRKGIFSSELGLTKTLNEKFERIVESINSDISFFDSFLSKIVIRYLPKQFEPIKLPSNFISNKRIRSKYNIERASAVIDAPVELHLITVLWIMKYGKYYDAILSEHAYGNRLLLNQERNDLIKGSSLFKPYYKQYQKWRDSAVKTAKAAIEGEEDVMFLNLDIKDYYYSIKLNIDELIEEKKNINSIYPNLLSVFKKIHVHFTEELKNNSFPFNYEGKLRENEVVLPIGLLSSYILGNFYLKEFDDTVLKKLKPHYYGRYVDDILFVVKNPICIDDVNEKTQNDLIISELNLILEEVSIAPKDPNPCIENKTVLRLKGEGYENLFCQPEKTLLYYFDHEESDLVIDKLKRELEERASEFRDFPVEDESSSFEESAYHLLYDGSEGKIKTLKDFKENRYGLSVFLSHKIFSALRHNRKMKLEDSKKILKFFKGLNCLEMFRLWEKVFTFFMVNNDPESFVDFYVHTFQQIDRIKHKFINVDINLTGNEVETALLEYLDCSLEMTLALNPYFTNRNKKAQKKLEFFQSEQRNWFSHLINPFSEPTNSNSFHIRRFRESNLIRHHYLIQPLINYTNIVRDKKNNLTGLEIPLRNNNKILALEETALDNSPRPVKFWECCIAVIYLKLAEIQDTLKDEKDDLGLDLFNLFIEKGNANETEKFSFYLEEAFKLYARINKIHLAAHIIDDENLKKTFYNFSKEKNIENCDLIEFHVNKEDKLTDIRISFANTEVNQQNIESSIRGIPQLDVNRYNTFQKIFKITREEKANILLLPENTLPYQFLSSLVRYSCDNSIMSVSGLEHWKVNNYCFNFIVSVLPVTVNGIKDAVVLIRLKNHYAPAEKEMIRGEHLYCPKPRKYRYDLINWRNLYFSPFYCFELADSVHRSMFRSKVDLLIASEWNPDTPYFSNIVEALSRDIHAYIAQVNTSQYGDSRLTKPSNSATKDILKLKGGKNDTVLIGEINLKSLRTFQRKNYNQTKNDKEFKPLPPDFNYKNAIKRERNENINEMN
ncbi:MAG: RNA-directed DNA polymerase [Bacteroidales bacterium]